MHRYDSFGTNQHEVTVVSPRQGSVSAQANTRPHAGSREHMQDGWSAPVSSPQAARPQVNPQVMHDDCSTPAPAFIAAQRLHGLNPQVARASSDDLHGRTRQQSPSQHPRQKRRRAKRHASAASDPVPKPRTPRTQSARETARQAALRRQAGSRQRDGPQRTGSRTRGRQSGSSSGSVARRPTTEWFDGVYFGDARSPDVEAARSDHSYSNT